MTVDVLPKLDGELIGSRYVPGGRLLSSAWTTYVAGMTEVNSLAAQRHLMTGDEFDDVMLDMRIMKYVSFGEDGTLRGLATLTNDLDAVPLVSSAYFARQWPEHFRERRVYYIPFTVVHPDHRKSSAFVELALAMGHEVNNHRGIVGLDVCRHNDEMHQFPQAIGSIASRNFRATTERVDEQSTWVYDFPGPGAS